MKWLIITTHFLMINVLHATPIDSELAKEKLKAIAHGDTQGHFVQKKYFKQLSQPFESSGSFAIKSESLTWQTETPIKQTLLYQDGIVMSTDAHGKLVKLAGAEPFVKVLSALLNGNIEVLSQFFSFDENESQCLLLTPDDNTLSTVLNSIEVCAELDKPILNFLDTNNNLTTISLDF